MIFTSSQRRDATSSDINVYNEFVQSLADSSPELAALGLEWRALASTTSVEAIDNTMTNFSDEDLGLPIYTVDGRLWIPNYRTLWGQDLDSLSFGFPSMDFDEFGIRITDLDREFEQFGELRVWTGIGGSANQELGNARARTGDALQTSREQLVWRAPRTSLLGRFYGVSGVLTAVPEPSNSPALLLWILVLVLRAVRKGQIDESLTATGIHLG